MFGSKYKKGDRVVYVSDPLTLKRLEDGAKALHVIDGKTFDPDIVPWYKLKYAEAAIECVHYITLNAKTYELYGILFDDASLNLLMDCPNQIFPPSELTPVVVIDPENLDKSKPESKDTAP